MATEAPAAPPAKSEPVGTGKPLGRVTLPDGLMDAIRSAATESAPKEKVAQGRTEGQAPPAAKPPDAAPEAKPEATPKPEAAATPTPDAKPKKSGIENVREAYERADARVKELEGTLGSTTKERADALAKLAEAEGKLKAADEKFAKEYEPQLKRLGEREKRAQELEEQLRMRDYTASPEWHRDYVAPIIAIQERASDLLQQLTVHDQNGNVRAATPEDFKRILDAQSLNNAEMIAKQLFGEGFATTELVRHSYDLRTALANQRKGMEKAKLESELWHKSQNEAREAQQARFTKMVREHVDRYVMKPAEADAEEARAYAEGEAWWNDFNRETIDPTLFAERVARIEGEVRNARIKDVRLKRLADENAALKTELARYRGSEPKVEAAISESGDNAAEEEPWGEKILRAARKVARGH